jgi:hypothetical protein
VLYLSVDRLQILGRYLGPNDPPKIGGTIGNSHRNANVAFKSCPYLCKL